MKNLWYNFVNMVDEDPHIWLPALFFVGFFVGAAWVS